MDTATLAAKQKRVNDWSDFIIAGGAQDPVVRRAIEERLEAFRQVLKRVWEAGSVGEADAAEMANLERQLVQLNEEARVRVVGRRTTGASVTSRA